MQTDEPDFVNKQKRVYLDKLMLNKHTTGGNQMSCINQNITISVWAVCIVMGNVSCTEGICHNYLLDKHAI